MRYIFSNKKYNFDKNIKYTKLLRAWVDLAENIHVNKLKNSLENTIIHINPGYIGELPSIRQERYLRSLIKRKLNFFYYIPKFKFLDLIKNLFKIYFYSFPNELKLSLMNVIYHRKYVDDYINYIKKKFPDINTFYTKEEFEAYTTYLTQKLQNMNIKVINYAHGLGVYCPIVDYDEFYVFNKSQEKFYIGNTKFKYYKKEVDFQIKRNNARDLGLVFLAQYILSKSNYFLVISTYKTIVDYIEKLAMDSDIQIFVKYHPNSRAEDLVFSEKIKVIKTLEDLPSDLNYLSLTMHSTYVMDIVDKMPFLILNPNNSLNMNYFFPNNDFIYIRSYEELNKRISYLREDPNNYYDFCEKFYKIIQDNI